jgi:acyl-coenzyme A synthetase/AMP-(fatty) acid ligase
MAKTINKRCLKTGKSVYQHLRDNNQENLDSVSQSYYGTETTFREDLERTDAFARAMNKLSNNSDSTVAFSMLAHPSSLIGYMAQNKQGRKASFINPTVIRDNPELTLDKLNTETLFISEPFYQTAKSGIAGSRVKNIIIVPLSEGATDEASLVADIKKHKGGAVKYLPAAVILKSLDKGYRALKKEDLIPGVNYYNYDEFIATAKGDNSPVPTAAAPDQPTLYLHTSGTTGVPKIIPKSDDNFTLSHNAYLSAEGLTFSIDDKNGNYYPLFPTTMMQGALSAWILGVELATNPLAAFNGLFAQNLFEQKITVVTANTQAWRTFLSTQLPDKSMSFLTRPFGGGEYMEKRVAHEINQRFQELGIPNRLILGYGTSEMHPGTHFMIVPFKEYNPERANVVGLGIGNVQTRVVDATGQPLPPGQRGLVEIKPDSKPHPYFGREDEWHKQWTEDGFYKTGDIGELDAAGHLHVHGRSKDKFTGRDGREYYLFDINRVLNDNPNILRVIPVKLSYPVKGKAGAIVAYIQLKPSHSDQAEATLRALAADAKTHLNAAARPLAYRFVKTFPIDGSTKTDFKTLAAQRRSFYTVNNDKIVQIEFSEAGKIVKKPAGKIRITAKLNTK